MRAFRFRLQTVLAARERARGAARGALAAALADVTAAADRLRDAEAAAAACAGELTDAAAPGRVDVSAWLDRRRHASTLTTTVITTQRAVTAAEAAAATARRAAADAEAGVKALERLRDRDRRGHAAAELAADERAAQDAWTAARFAPHTSSRNA